MLQFHYTACNTRGRTIDGTVNAHTAAAATVKLQKRGWIIQHLRPTIARFDGEQLAGFTRQLFELLDAGIQLSRAIEMIAAQSKPKVTAILRYIADEVRTGKPLWQTLRLFPKIFDEIYVRLVQAGEASGCLTQMLGHLAEFLEQKRHIFKKLAAALMYPAIVATLTLIVAYGLMTFVIPRFKTVLDMNATTLPALTRGILTLSQIFPYALICFILMGMGLCIGISVNKNFKNYLKKILENLPFVRSMVRLLDAQHLATYTSLMLHNGIPVLGCIDLILPILRSEHYRQRLPLARRNIADGVPVSEAFEQAGLLSHYAIGMIHVGENTAKLAHAFNRMGQYYQREILNTLRKWVTLLEPTLILLLTVCVGITIFGLLMPILQTVQKMSS